MKRLSQQVMPKKRILKKRNKQVMKMEEGEDSEVDGK